MFSQSNSVEAGDVKARFSELLERVEGGEELTITEDGLAVAKLVPIRRTTTVEQRAAAIRRWLETSKTLRLRGLRIRDLIDEGRL